MRKFILLIIIPFVMPNTLSANEYKMLPGVQYLLLFDHTKLSTLYSILCETEQCDVFEGFGTTKNCVDALDKYFTKAGNSLPSCIPSYTEIQENDPIPTSELWCYANWRLGQIECTPFFDPAIDLYLIIDESNGTSEYEVCLMNKAAQKDVCASSREFFCYYDCETTVNEPCYAEFEINGDQDALNSCLADLQPLVDQCIAENCNSYLYPDE